MIEQLQIARDLLEIASILLFPVFGWLLWSTFQQGNKIIVLEERNSDTKRRLEKIEEEFRRFDEKLDTISEELKVLSVQCSTSNDKFERY